MPNGFVAHGKTQPDGTFLAYVTLNGQTVWGNYADDDSFYSSDGTIHIKTDGTVEYGITDPVTKNFLPGGVIRTVDSQSVYGTINNDGSFISEDGTLLVLPDGFVEHGKIQSDNTFLAYLMINGQQVWGNFGTDHSFLSQDGHTYVKPDGTIEYGVTDPSNGTFLNGGVAYTLPDNTVAYGFMDNGSFYSYKGDLIVVNGQVITGSTDTGDSIFAGNNGDFYFISDNGIIPVTPLPDGSYELPDGSRVMTPTSWKVDLKQFQEAMLTVAGNIQAISTTYNGQIASLFNSVEADWKSPAGQTFGETVPLVDAAMKNLLEILTGVLLIMEVNYANYIQAEETNIAAYDLHKKPS
jgi:hypothetical protein